MPFSFSQRPVFQPHRFRKVLYFTLAALAGVKFAQHGLAQASLPDFGQAICYAGLGYLVAKTATRV